jgi:hypothetical protein
MLPDRFTLAPWKEEQRHFGLRRCDPPGVDPLPLAAYRDPMLFGVDDRLRVAAPFRSHRAEHELALDALEHRTRHHRRYRQRGEKVSHPLKSDRANCLFHSAF